MRSIWKGSISFGLVSIPIKVVSATANHSVSFHQLHTADGGRIRYRKVCELEDKEVPSEEIGKGFETEDGETVQLTDADLAALPLPTAKTVEILGFVPREEIDPIQLDRSYYLAVDGQSAAKPYALLREALERSDRVAVVKLALRGRESLGMLRVYEDVLALHTMLWPDEIRSAQGVAPEGEVTVRSAELDLADTLMDTLGELDWDSLRDEYREAVEQLVERKREGLGEEELPVAAQRPAGNVVDLMAVLENSVQAAQESRGGGKEEATVHQMPGRTSSAKKTAGKEAEGKETAGKKAAGKAPAKKAAPGKKAAEEKKSAAAKASPAKKGASAAKKSASGKKAASAKKGAAKKTSGPRKSA